MKKLSQLSVLVIVWAIAMASMVGTSTVMKYVRKEKTEKDRNEILDKIRGGKEAYELLNSDFALAVQRGECGLINIDGEWILVGKDCEKAEYDLAIRENTIHQIVDYDEPDLKTVLSNTIKRSIYTKAPEWQKKMLQHRRAIVLHDNDGTYFMILSRNEIPRYIEQYGKECVTCR